MITNSINSKGYVYILINISMPGLVKVGKSTRSPEIRAAELSQASGVPHSFQIVYQTLVDNCDLAEREVHRFLNPFRENSNREFFRIPVNRAIDVLRKVISENNLQESDHEIDPYRFAYEEFHSAEALFQKVISNEKYWEQAKLHLKEGFLMNWLKNKSEFDALVNAEQYKNRKDDLDYYFALIIFSIVPGDFKIFGYKISSVGDIRNNFEKEFDDDSGFLTIYLSGKLSKIYEGFLNSRGTTENEVSKFLSFTNSSSGKLVEERKEKLRKILEWKNNSSKFLHFDTMNFDKVDYLLRKSEWKEQAELLNIPTDVTEKAFSTDEKDVIESVKYLKEVKSLVIKKLNNSQKCVIDFSKFVPKQEYLKEIKELSGKEYLTFLQNAYSLEELKRLREEYFLPESFVNTIINSRSFYDYLIILECLSFLEGKYDSSQFDYLKFRSNIHEVYGDYFKKILSRFEVVYPNAESKNLIREKVYNSGNLSILRKYYDEMKRAVSYFSIERSLLIKNIQLQEKVEYIIERYLIPLDLKNGIQAGDLKSINDFYSSQFLLIEKSVLDDRVINKNLYYSFVNGFKKDFEDTLKILSKAYNREFASLYYQLNSFSGFNGVTKFSLDFIPTNQFLSSLSLPSHLRNKLRSDNVDEYLDGLSVFFEYANFWIPKKTHKVLEDEFVLPESVLKNLVGFNIDQYLRSVEFLISNGLEIINGLEEFSTNLGVKGFLKVNWGLSRKPNDRKLSKKLTPEETRFSSILGNLAKDEYSYFDKGKFSYRTNYRESRSKVVLTLWDANVEKSCLIHYDHTLITKKDLSEYKKNLDAEALTYFHSIFRLGFDNYAEAKRVLISGYDKRLDSRFTVLIKNIDLKFEFLPNELRKHLKDYFSNLSNGKLQLSKSDLNFFVQLEEFAQMNSFSFTLKKRKFHSFLKEHYHKYSPKYDFYSSILNYLSENS